MKEEVTKLESQITNWSAKITTLEMDCSTYQAKTSGDLKMISAALGEIKANTLKAKAQGAMDLVANGVAKVVGSLVKLGG